MGWRGLRNTIKVFEKGIGMSGGRREGAVGYHDARMGEARDATSGINRSCFPNLLLAEYHQYTTSDTYITAKKRCKNVNIRLFLRSPSSQPSVPCNTVITKLTQKQQPQRRRQTLNQSTYSSLLQHHHSPFPALARSAPLLAQAAHSMLGSIHSPPPRLQTQTQMPSYTGPPRHRWPSS